MAYDSARGRVVLFGGLGLGGCRRGDTWEWDGTAWIEKAPATSPSARSGHAMACDSFRGRVVVFGGYDGSYRGDTWEYSGAVGQCGPDGTPCDDGNPCTTNDTCSNGICVGGPLLNCDDRNSCTDDHCDPGTGCTHSNNTNPCDDG